MSCSSEKYDFQPLVFYLSPSFIGCYGRFASKDSGCETNAIAKAQPVVLCFRYERPSKICNVLVYRDDIQVEAAQYRENIPFWNGGLHQLSGDFTQICRTDRTLLKCLFGDVRPGLTLQQCKKR